MILACLCGGIVEFMIFAIVSFAAPIITVCNINRKRFMNSRLHKKTVCPCDCHDEPLQLEQKQ